LQKLRSLEREEAVLITSRALLGASDLIKAITLHLIASSSPGAAANTRNQKGISVQPNKAKSKIRKEMNC
jgi:hypothetical protein